jgi:MFS transporter, SP family, solute carrier family 2 (facilitated glucose transporter), member 3
MFSFNHALIEICKIKFLQNKITFFYTQTRGWNKVLLLTGLATTIGSANVAGYNIGVINAPSSYMKAWMNETLISNYNVELSVSSIELLWSFVVSIFLIGGAIGSLGGSYVADRIGR